MYSNPTTSLTTQWEFINGKRDINPFKNILPLTPTDQGNFRNFHTLPTKPYYEGRSKWKNFDRTYFENCNNVYKPLTSLPLSFIEPSDSTKVFMNDTSLPYHMSAHTPITQFKIGAKKQFAKSFLWQQLERNRRTGHFL